MRHKRLPAAAGLLLALALPILASAHEITNVDVDCETQSVHVTGKMFAVHGGATVTVTGPEGYLQSFFADKDEAWTVTLPLGADGTYMIDWPNSGDFGPVTFEVDCVLATEEPSPTGTAEPTQEPTSEPTPTGTALPTEEPTITPAGAVLAETGVAGGAGATLPPTDTTAVAVSQSVNTGVVFALFGLTSLTVLTLLWTLDRRARIADRDR